MSVYRFNPLQDVRWSALLGSHPQASIFHSAVWLRALQRSYGYQPLAYTTSPARDPLRNAILFCRVRSWLTGSRLVSLPFSDHCQPLMENSGALAEILDHLQSQRRRESWRYIEIRPRDLQAQGEIPGIEVTPSESFVWQGIDLRPELPQIFAGFHKSCVQRKIRKAERDGVTCVEGRSKEILHHLYRLSIVTRKRHGLPPQPITWFRHLLESLGELALIRIAMYREKPIAAILTLGFKQTLMYKYGCSDERFHNLGAMPLLFWRAIEAGKQDGAVEFDLGRSETDNTGLIHFKQNFGAASAPLHYFRLPARPARVRTEWATQMARDLFARMPRPVLTVTSRLLYRHLG